MKKVVKFFSLFMLAGATLLSSGCSCSLSKSKLEERTSAVYESEVDYNSNFTIEVKTVSKQEQEDGKIEVSELFIKTTRNVESKSFVFNIETKSGYEGEKLKDFPIKPSTEKIYQDGELIFAENIAGNITQLNQLSLIYSYQETESLAKNSTLLMDYFQYGVGMYDQYKETVYHGCSPSGDVTKVPNIHKASVDSEMDKKESFSCKAKKKLFGKDATYTLKYRISISEIVEVIIKTDKNNNIIEATQHNIVAVAGENPINATTTFKIYR